MTEGKVLIWGPNSSLVCEHPNASARQVQILSLVERLFMLSGEIEPVLKAEPICRKLNNGIVWISKLFIICLFIEHSKTPNISACLLWNSNNFQILLLVVSSDFGNFSLSYCLCLYLWMNTYKSPVISAICIIENGTLPLGFHLALCLNLLKGVANFCY